ncbi:ArsR family transcriptional regulator [Candidatus Woesearchaeota archaeon]|nr:ArsR family transcriptional regulator [Candidatus Woesearchaeota archaeon]
MDEIDNLIGFIISSNRRKEVLKELSKKPKRPMELCKKLDLDTGNIARLLFQLEKKNVIKCVTPEKRSWRVYMITSLGEEVLKKIE